MVYISTVVDPWRMRRACATTLQIFFFILQSSHDDGSLICAQLKESKFLGGLCSQQLMKKWNLYAGHLFSTYLHKSMWSEYSHHTPRFTASINRTFLLSIWISQRSANPWGGGAPKDIIRSIFLKTAWQWIKFGPGGRGCSHYEIWL